MDAYIPCLKTRGFTRRCVKKSKSARALPEKALKDAITFIGAKEKGITKKWLEFFGKNQKPSFEKITRKI